jgi:hypothetical protein
MPVPTAPHPEDVTRRLSAEGQAIYHRLARAAFVALLERDALDDEPENCSDYDLGKVVRELNAATAAFDAHAGSDTLFDLLEEAKACQRGLSDVAFDYRAAAMGRV